MKTVAESEHFVAKDQGDANVFVLLKDGSFFASLFFNGEMTTDTQVENMRAIVGALAHPDAKKNSYKAAYGAYSPLWELVKEDEPHTFKILYDDNWFLRVVIDQRLVVASQCRQLYCILDAVALHN